ncbi:MAG: hemerythrin domain-containing protein [Actinomycetes bacterium]
MSSITAAVPPFLPRQEQDPEPDLTTYRLVQRAMTRDLRRLAALTADVAAGVDEAWLDPTRAHALGRYACDLFAEVRRRHEAEEQVLWPVLRSVAGADVVLDGLADDHSVLGPMVERARNAVVLLADSPHDVMRARWCASATAELHQVMDEHVADEEREVFPVIRRYLTVEAYAWVETRLQKATPLIDLTFVVPWLDAVADDAERAQAMERAGLPFRLLLAATRSHHARRECAVFG